MYGINAYKSVQANTVSPWKLIDMLYEGAIDAIKKKDYQKAERIIDAGLIGGLNPDLEFSHGLLNTYEIAIANLYTKPEISLKVIETLREGWLGINPDKQIAQKSNNMP